MVDNQVTRVGLGWPNRQPAQVCVKAFDQIVNRVGFGSGQNWPSPNLTLPDQIVTPK